MILGLSTLMISGVLHLAPGVVPQPVVGELSDKPARPFCFSGLVGARRSILLPAKRGGRTGRSSAKPQRWQQSFFTAGRFSREALAACDDRPASAKSIAGERPAVLLHSS